MFTSSSLVFLLPVQSAWLTKKRTPPRKKDARRPDSVERRLQAPANPSRSTAANLGFQREGKFALGDLGDWATRTSRLPRYLDWSIRSTCRARQSQMDWADLPCTGLYHGPIYRNSFRRSRPILIVRPLGRAERRGWGAPRRRLESGGIPATGSTIRSFLFGICSASRSTRCSPSTSPWRPPPFPTGSCSTP